MKIYLSIIILLLLNINTAKAQTREKAPNEIALVLGVGQVLIADGFNFEVNYFTNKLVFDFSHGMSLDTDNKATTGDVKKQGLAVHTPYSTGVGVGYRFNKLINLRVEPKLHSYELFYAKEEQSNANRITKYKTLTLGVGLYLKWQPFEREDNALRGIMIAPSVRYWPTISSSLDNDEVTYFNKTTQKQEKHEALNIGLNNTPLIVNLSVGYSFQLKNK